MLHNDDLKFHVDTLRGGGVVALPTETVYGLACLALNKISVQKVFKIKGRPTSNPLIVHVLDFEQAEAISFTNEIAKELKLNGCKVKVIQPPKYFNEKYLIKDKNGAILKKSENLNQLINKTSWNKLKLIK